MGAAHALGIVHRDIKPDNLFLAESPYHPPVLKILDFGIARVRPDAPPDAPVPVAIPTGTGQVIGTPRFISPEAALGAKVDTRADLYGAALVLYAMLAGRGPFDHFASDGALLLAHSIEDPTPPSQHAREPVPVELDRVVLEALEKHPDARFQTVAEFRAELEHVVSLLAKPAGWLDTTAFDRHAIEHGALPSREDKAGVHPAIDASPIKAPVPLRTLALLFAIGVVATTLLTLAIATLMGQRVQSVP